MLENKTHQFYITNQGYLSNLCFNASVEKQFFIIENAYLRLGCRSGALVRS